MRLFGAAKAFSDGAAAGGAASRRPANPKDRAADLEKRLAEANDRAVAAEARLSHGGGADVAKLRQMLDNMPVNVMICELKNFTIEYMNATTLKTLKSIEHLLPTSADKLLGQCIDIFHKDPSHQRRMLANPKNLPHNAQIKLGDEILDLLVTGIFDDAGNYNAAMLTWSIITQKAKADADATRLMNMVEEMPINVMMCDPEDFTITYANKTSLTTLKSIEHLLPIKADQIVGACIDVFHKNPAHQRRLLADPKNLPHSAQIKLGEEILDLLVTPIRDKQGKYIGPMLSWSVITQKAKADAESVKLREMVDNMPINIMMADPEDFTITYINKTSLSTLKSIEHLLPIKADEVLGSCIDVFHKNPQHQRKMLANPKNLPHKANISLGDQTLSLNVAPIFDKQGKYIGPMVSWAVVTEQIKLATNMKGAVEVVASAAQEMQASAQSMSATAEETNKQSMAVAAASEEAAQNVQTVAAAAEELSSSINEISRQVSQSNTISQEAVAQSQKTNATVQGLAEAAQKIGEVVNLINDIASQTNLLALNATIEAARAGEAGKGFAVVASEVKNLANQTAKATEEIAAQITSMQSVTSEAVTAIDGITKTIGKISEIAGAISAAVEEQGAATQEISQNVAQAAAGTNEVSSNISGVTQAAQESGHTASQVLDAARSLAQEGDRMRQEVEAFLAKLNG